jgi:arachidonate 15-lipoxygenase
LRYPPPEIPAEFLGSPDLGSLAVRGPYAAYTTRVGDGVFEWDTESLSRYEHHPGLRRLGTRVRFELDRRNRALRATRISSVLGDTTPEDARWEGAKKLALCSMTTHLSLVRHFNWVHLAGGAMSTVATRNQLPPEHPLLRLLWPHMYDTQQSNDTVTRGQMVRGGDFECCFSLTFEGMCRLFDDTWGEFDLRMSDPPEDANRRGVTGQGFDTPTEDNLASIFGTLLEYAEGYLRLYWDDDAALRADRAAMAWLDELNQRIPNGVGVASADATLGGVARLAARLIYLASAQHEILGSFLWNYQLWTHRQPVRVYANGQREPLDVYQRLVNANFNLNVRRRALMHDFSYLALDTEGAAAMKRFRTRLEALQARMEREPWAAWKLYPAVLKVNINA